MLFHDPTITLLGIYPGEAFMHVLCIDPGSSLRHRIYSNSLSRKAFIRINGFRIIERAKNSRLCFQEWLPKITELGQQRSCCSSAIRKPLVPEPDCCCQVQLVVTAHNCHNQEMTMIRKLLLLLLGPDQHHDCEDHITNTDHLVWLLTPAKLMTSHGGLVNT